MGKERKEAKDDKKHKRKRASSSSPQLHDEGKSKKHRNLGDEEAKREKKDKSRSKKHKSHKSSKSRSHSKGKKSAKKHREKSHKHGVLSKYEVQELSSVDYYSKNNEFATWLKEEKKLYFSDLSSESARDLFSEFVAEWNDHKLEDHYYEGITTGPRTSHKWNIKV